MGSTAGMRRIGGATGALHFVWDAPMRAAQRPQSKHIVLIAE